MLMYHVTFGQKVPKLNSRQVYCSRLYGIWKKEYRKVASSRPVYYLILELFGQRSQYKSIQFPLLKPSENVLLTETSYCSQHYFT